MNIINALSGAVRMASDAVVATATGVRNTAVNAAAAANEYTFGVQVEELNYQDVPKRPNRNNQCPRCPRVIKQRERSDGQIWGGMAYRPVVSLRTPEGRRVYAHQTCATGSPSLVKRVCTGVRQIASGVATGIVRHPVRAAIAGLALAGAIMLTSKAIQESAVDSHVYCLVESATNELWCATKSVTESAANAVFERFSPTTIYTHSGEFITRAYDELAGGAEVILGVTRKYFAQNPLPIMLAKAREYLPL